MTRWVMVADLERCVGCQTCVAACRHANATSPAEQWRRVLDVEAGIYPDVSRVFVPTGCQHCADPPCMHVCPTTATRQRADGIVTIDYDLCIGCAYCEVACPYQARFLTNEPHYAYGAAMRNETERSDQNRVGVAQKCTYCVDRIDFGLANGLIPGIDSRATPACANACIADALHFGDIDDSNSNVSRLLREQPSFRMHAELSTDPSFHYIYSAALEPAAAAASATTARVGDNDQARNRAAQPARQEHWNWKAAGNFICGGMGAGLLIFASLTSLLYGEVNPAGWIALALIALGLFLVLLKIGRPLRSIYVLRQPQRSWMAREAWLAIVLFALAALALWFRVPALLVGAAIVAMAFLYSQAKILGEAKGIPAWREPRIVPLIVATGLAEGSGLFLVASTQLTTARSLIEISAVAAVVLAAWRSWVWRSYFGALRREGAPTRTLLTLEAFRPWFFGLGLALPLMLVVVGFITPTLASLLFATGGLVSAFAGAALKFVLVDRAGFNQGFALTSTPTRGGLRAGQPIKPGWSMS
jgi:phenylacetyl-CoA:acceptor oxidoreductase subunit 1